MKFSFTTKLILSTHFEAGISYYSLKYKDLVFLFFVTPSIINEFFIFILATIFLCNWTQPCILMINNLLFIHQFLYNSIRFLEDYQIKAFIVICIKSNLFFFQPLLLILIVFYYFNLSMDYGYLFLKSYTSHYQVLLMNLF